MPLNSYKLIYCRVQHAGSHQNHLKKNYGLICSFQAYLGGEGPIEGVADGSYDLVVMSGGFAHGHLSIEVLRQAARALKPKTGLFVNSMKELYITSVPQLRGLETLMGQMEQEGIWKWTCQRC